MPASFRRKITDPEMHARLACGLLTGFAFTLPLSIATTVFFESLLLALWLFGGHGKAKLASLRSSPLSLLVLAFIGYNLIVLLWTSDLRYGLDYIGKYRHFLLIPVIVYYLRPAAFSRLLNAFLAAMVIASLLSLAIHFQLVSLDGVAPNDPSPFLNHTDFSNFLAFAALAVLIRHLEAKHGLAYSHDVALFLFFLTVLFMNAGRTGQVAFLAGLVLLTLLASRHRLRTLLMAAAVVSATVVTVYQFSSVFQSRMVQTLTDLEQIRQGDFTGSFGIRIHLWKLGAEVITQKPILGHGVGDERTAIRKHIQELGINRPFEGNADVHNTFIHLWLQGGIANFALAFLFLIRILRLPVGDSGLSRLRHVFLLIVFINALGGNAYHLFHAMTFLALFGGALEALSVHRMADTLGGKAHHAPA